MKILIMGSTGNQGTRLVPRFAQAGFHVRAVRATPGRDQEVLAMGAKEVFVGDATDRKFLAKAVAGMDVVYHIGPTAHPQEREIGFAMVDAAREARIGHLIYSSTLHPIARPMPQHDLKRDVEEYLLEANIPYTVLQPADFLMPRSFHLAFETGKWEFFFNLDSGQAMVALTDVADVAVKVAREREHHFGATYQLCAPGTPSGNDIAAAIQKVTGRPTQAAFISPDAFFERYFGIGGGEKFRYQLNMIRAVGLWYSQYTFAGNPNVLTWLLGRKPTTLEEFIANEWQNYQSRRKSA